MALPPSTRAVLTGAASGLGKALALALARRGSRLLLSDLNQDGAEQVAREARAAGAREAETARCDVTKVADVEALAERTMQLWGGLDLLVNNAGVGVGGDVGKTSLDDWHHALDVNLWGVIHGCHVFVPILRRQGTGHLLNVASIAGLVYAPHMAPYNVSKAGVVALSETLRAELARHGVGVTTLCPSFFETNILNESRGIDERQLRFARSRMARSPLDAAGVADAALAAVEAGQLHALPMSDARWMWLARRLSPELFSRALVKLRERAAARRGG